MKYKVGMYVEEEDSFAGLRVLKVGVGGCEVASIIDGEEDGSMFYTDAEMGDYGPWIDPDTKKEYCFADNNSQKEDKKMAQSELTNLKDELFGATLEGAKAGLAASMGRKITDLVIKSTGVTLPGFFQAGIGKDVLPIAVCYAVAFLSMVVPGVPGSDKVRKYCILCARGSATVLVNNIEFMDKIEQLTTFISGMAANNPLEDK